MKRHILLAIITAAACLLSSSCKKIHPIGSDGINTDPTKIGVLFQDFSWEIDDDSIIDYKILSRAELIRTGYPFAVLFVDDPNCEKCTALTEYINKAMELDGLKNETFKKFYFIVVSTKQFSEMRYQDLAKNYKANLDRLAPTMFRVIVDEQTFSNYSGAVHPALFVCNRKAVVRSHIIARENYFMSKKADINYIDDLRAAFLSVIHEDR